MTFFLILALDFIAIYVAIDVWFPS